MTQPGGARPASLRVASTPGGEIHTGGASAADVRLTLADGARLADNAPADVALYLSDRTGAEPATVVVYATNGRLLATQAVF